jgi:hypothetical protein
MKEVGNEKQKNLFVGLEILFIWLRECPVEHLEELNYLFVGFGNPLNLASRLSCGTSRRPVNKQVIFKIPIFNK